MSKQWEYLVVGLEGIPLTLKEGRLERRGVDGWELVSVDNAVAYMKREKKEAEPQEPAFPAINDPWSAKAVQKVVTQAEVMQ